MPPGFSGNLIFAIIARMLCGNHLNFEYVDVGCNYNLLFLKSLRKSIAVYTVILFSYCRYIVGLYIVGHNKTKMLFNTAVFFLFFQYSTVFIVS